MLRQQQRQQQISESKYFQQRLCMVDGQQFSQAATKPSTPPPPIISTLLPPRVLLKSMTSDKARTALGAGASLALRPTPTPLAGSSASSELAAMDGTADHLQHHGRSRSENIDEMDDDLGGKMAAYDVGGPATTATGMGGSGSSGTAAAAEAVSGDGGRDGNYGLFSLRFRSGLLGKSNKGANPSAGGNSVNGASSTSGGGATAGEMPPPPPRPPSAQANDAAAGSEATSTADVAAATVPAVWFPDPFQQQQSGRLSELPENEEVVPKSPKASLEGARVGGTAVCLSGIFLFFVLSLTSAASKLLPTRASPRYISREGGTNLVGSFVVFCRHPVPLVLFCFVVPRCSNSCEVRELIPRVFLLLCRIVFSKLLPIRTYN